MNDIYKTLLGISKLSRLIIKGMLALEHVLELNDIPMHGRFVIAVHRDNKLGDGEK